MPNSENTQTPQSNTVMTVRVKRIAPIGLIVDLGDCREGLIREREIAWDAEERQNWRERFLPGDAVLATLSGRRVGRRHELSIRLAAADSWVDVEEKYPVGEVVAGVITGVVPYGVFVDLEPGVAGLVHKTQLPAWIKEQHGKAFALGDEVFVAINAVDMIARRISLSMLNLTRSRWNKRPNPNRAFAHHQTPDQNSHRSQLKIDMLLRTTPKTVLVVEDEPDQRWAVVEWMHFAGQRAQSAGTVQEAVDAIEDTYPDLLLMDVGLPDEDGIEGLKRIRARCPGLRCALMTDWGRAESQATELEKLRTEGIPLLPKPLLPEDLIGLLLDEPPGNQPLAAAVLPACTALERLQPVLRETDTTEMAAMLARLRLAVRADKVVVFELDPDLQTMGVLEESGSPPLVINVLPDLIHSPVRDVAEDRKTLVLDNLQQARMPRFRHLVPLLNFEACLGLPVPAMARCRYALFVFFARPVTITELIQARSEAVAASVQTWLERRQFLKQAADMHRVTLLGQLGRALVHEVSGRLTPLGLALEQLNARCNEIELHANDDPVRIIDNCRQGRNAIQKLKQQRDSLANLLLSFSRMTRPGEEELVRLDDVIREAVEILHHLAATSNVAVVVVPAPRLYFTRTHVTHLQQVLVNVIQNAIQQIGQTQPRRRGQVEIRMSQTVSSDKQMVQVFVEDDGPGIHRRLWERIFDLDFTTRPDGSGLGLYMSRNLIESQGGHIYVASSYMLWGSTFAIGIPYRI